MSAFLVIVITSRRVAASPVIIPAADHLFSHSIANAKKHIPVK